MSNVESLFGDEVHTPEAQERTVQLAAELLEMARSGEIIALHGVCVHADEATTVRSVGHIDRRVVGAAAELQHRLITLLLEG